VDGDLVRRAVRIGLIGGIVTVYLAVTGMIVNFDTRVLIGYQVTLGKSLMAIPAFLAAYVLARPRIKAGTLMALPPGQAVSAGALAGAVTGGIVISMAALTLPFDAFTVRSIFVQVSPQLIDTLTFGQSWPVAAVIQVFGLAFIGALGAGLRVLPDRIRRPVVVGMLATLVMAVFQTIIPPVFQNHASINHIGWLYSPITGGLTVFGAIVVFAVSVALWFLVQARRERVRRQYTGLPAEARRGVSIFLLALLALFLIWLPILLGSNLTQILGTVGYYVLLGLGLNIVVGYAGLLDLGYVAFFAVGAYGTGLLTGAHLVTSLGAVADPAFVLHLNFYVALPILVLIAAFVGLLIGAPVLRLRGDYLAIVTLGFGEIARILVTSDWLKNFLGGAQGLRDVTNAQIGSISFQNPLPFFYLVSIFCLGAVFVSRRLAGSRVGRAWNAMREDEQVAEAMGVSTVKYKLLAFATGAGIGSLSGALYAVKIGSLGPASFTVLVSITVLAIVILGGLGSIPGVVLAALILIGLPGFLTEFSEYQLLLYGAALIAIMLLRPQGLIPNVRRMRELKEEEVSQDAWAKRTGDASVAATLTVGGAETATEGERVE
jgi:branched-chain amino acid transport system permease protein